jgi:hypothetical protein
MISRTLLASAAIFALAAPAGATTYIFSMSGDLDGSWKLPASPVPDSAASPFFFSIDNVSLTFQGLPYNATLFFYTGPLGGMAADSSGILFDLLGPQLFTGPETAPTFTLGSFPLLSFGGESVTLTITAVPEAGSWAMMIAGFGLVGAGLRRRRTAASA